MANKNEIRTTLGFPTLHNAEKEGAHRLWAVVRLFSPNAGWVNTYRAVSHMAARSATSKISVSGEIAGALSYLRWESRRAIHDSVRFIAR